MPHYTVRMKTIALPSGERVPARAQENIGALGHSLTPAQLAELSTLFPPPAGPQPLEML